MAQHKWLGACFFCLQAIEKNAEPVAHDLAQQILKPAAAAAASADPAAKQFSEEGIKPAANIIAENVQPVAKGFTDQTLLPTAQKVGICRTSCNSSHWTC